MPIERISPVELADRLADDVPPLILDVRRRAAFAERPRHIPGAMPLILDADPIRIPDLPSHRPVVTACLCRGEASSLRAAQGSLEAGHDRVAVLAGGLQGWRAAGLAVTDVDLEVATALQWRPLPRPAGRRGWTSTASWCR